MVKGLARCLVALVALYHDGVSATPTRRNNLDIFIKTQNDVSIKGVLANIGPDGSRAQGASAGAVVASPSRTDPDCKWSLLLLFVHFLQLLIGMTRLVHLDKRFCTHV